MKADINSEGYLVISDISKFSPSKGLQIISQRDGANLAKDSFEATTEAIAYKKMYEEAKLSANDSVRYKTLYEAELARRKELERQLLKERETVEKTNVILGYLAACVTGSGHAHYLKGFINGSIRSGNASEELKEQVSSYLDDIDGVPKLAESAINDCKKMLENK